MKLLVIGNSQAGAIKRSHDRQAAAVSAAGIQMHFHVIPGGVGPDLHVADGHIAVGATAPTHPPYVWPAGTDSRPLAYFDAILFSALGYADGGFAFKSPLPICGVLAEYGPSAAAAERGLVSDTCFAAMAQALFDQQPGFRALQAVTAAFAGPVHVQPFPRLSEAVLGHPDWRLGQWYDDPVGMHVFIETVKDGYLAAIAARTGAQILPYALADRADLFTPQDLMRPGDGVHQSDAYGASVLEQLVGHLRA